MNIQPPPPINVLVTVQVLPNNNFKNDKNLRNY